MERKEKNRLSRKGKFLYVKEKFEMKKKRFIIAEISRDMQLNLFIAYSTALYAPYFKSNPH